MDPNDVVRAVLGPHGPIEGDLLPWLCGLRRRPTKRHGAMLRDGCLYYDRAAAPDERHRMMARECARFLLRRYGVDPTAEAVDRVAGALVKSSSADRAETSRCSQSTPE